MKQRPAPVRILIMDTRQGALNLSSHIDAKTGRLGSRPDLHLAFGLTHAQEEFQDAIARNRPFTLVVASQEMAHTAEGTVPSWLRGAPLLLLDDGAHPRPAPTHGLRVIARAAGMDAILSLVTDYLSPVAA